MRFQFWSTAHVLAINFYDNMEGLQILAFCATIEGRCNYWESRAIHCSAEAATNKLEGRLRVALVSCLEQLAPDRGWNAYPFLGRINLWYRHDTITTVHFEFDKGGTMVDFYYETGGNYKFRNCFLKRYKERLDEITALYPKVAQFIAEFK